MNVCSVVGARPQFVKASVVSRRLRAVGEEVLVNTGQHYDDELSSVFFEELDLPSPDIDLGVGSDSHARQTAAMVTGIESIVESVGPDVLLCYGDTNTTLAAAIVGAKRDLVLAHVEAGLRSDNWSMPEEVNRVLTDHAADRLYAPSQTAVDRLATEGITDGVVFSGDVMYDTLLAVRDRALEHSTIVDDLDLDSRTFTLATVHRAGNTDDPSRLKGIVEGLARSPQPVIFPIHPRTQDRLAETGLDERVREPIVPIDPVGYLDFVRLLSAADRVATDSGGVQKEAFFLDTPCVTLREETEWVETVECGWNRLVGADQRRIADALEGDLTPETARKPRPYGDGRAAHRIVADLRNTLGEEAETALDDSADTYSLRTD